MLNSAFKADLCVRSLASHGCEQSLASTCSRAMGWKPVLFVILSHSSQVIPGFAISRSHTLASAELFRSRALLLYFCVHLM